ncbi:MAG: hypothetical protein AAF716_03410 [Cyanobacteria bacterium P01_D01_bin.1]
MFDWLRSPKVVGSIIISVLLITGTLQSSTFVELILSLQDPVVESDESAKADVIVKFYVTDMDSGEPIENVTGKFIFDGAPIIRYTDGNGYMSVEIPARKEVRVRLEARGYRPSDQTINLAVNRETVEYRLEKEISESSNGAESTEDDDRLVQNFEDGDDVESNRTDSDEDDLFDPAQALETGELSEEPQPRTGAERNSPNSTVEGTLPRQSAEGYYYNANNWSRWRVVVLQLSCRSNPSLQGREISILHADELVYLDKEAGDPIALDNEGKPFLRVSRGSETCFTRARSRYIVPLSMSEQRSEVLREKSSMPQQDSNGYYFDTRSWETWRVVPLRLSCRERPSLQSQNVFTFNTDSLIRTSLPARSAILMGSDKLPWLKINRNNGGTCFVKARSRYIIPSK